MTTNQIQDVLLIGHTIDLTFAGDNVRLAGQIDYPDRPKPEQGYPLLFILHHAGCNTRADYQHYARIGLMSGYAVFRWDKRGTGQSGAGGHGSTTQDAVNAYEIALEQPDINRKQVVILAQGSGTGLIGSAFGLFARVQHPTGVVLVSNNLDERDILAIEAPVQIVVGQNDWNDCELFAKGSAQAHKKAYEHGAAYYVAPGAERNLMDLRYDPPVFHPGAREIIGDWLASLV